MGARESFAKPGDDFGLHQPVQKVPLSEIKKKVSKFQPAMYKFKTATNGGKYVRL